MAFRTQKSQKQPTEILIPSRLFKDEEGEAFHLYNCKDEKYNKFYPAVLAVACGYFLYRSLFANRDFDDEEIEAPSPLGDWVCTVVCAGLLGLQYFRVTRTVGDQLDPSSSA